MTDIFRLTTSQTLLGSDGKALSSGQVHFYDKKTGQYATVYGDAAKLVSLRQPVQADSDGVLPLVYLDDSTEYRAVITDSQNSRLREIGEVLRDREGIKVIHGLTGLKAYCGQDSLVLVTLNSGCPVFYTRMKGCGDLPKEHLPDIVHTECCTVWTMCRNEPNICATETAELNCDFQVLVQECPRQVSDPAVGCDCDTTLPQKSAPPIKKASIGALINAATKCLDRVCIPYDAPEFALVGNTMVYGDRQPTPIMGGTLSGTRSGCVRVQVDKDGDPVSRHIQLDTIKDLGGVPVYYPRITLRNDGPCKKRFELRAINRLNRANENPPTRADFGEVPIVDANFQTRFGKEFDPLLDSVLGVADFQLSLPWLTELSIADSTMGSFRSGFVYSRPANDDPFASANGYTQNDLIVDINPGDVVTYALKYHIYWDMDASREALSAPERIHFGTKIIARQVR
jgi:hypothetical protein